MPKPKDARIWNEDLFAALEARYQKSLREGKRDAHTWQKGMGQISAVRKDIYCFSNGRIANLPNDLSKTVTRLCEDVIRGVKNVYPDGHVPSNGGGGGHGYHAGISAASASPVRSVRGNAVGSVVCANCGSSDVERHDEAQVFVCGDCGNVIESAGAMGGSVASFAPVVAPSVASATGNNPYSNDNYMKKIKIRGGAFAILMAFHHSQTDVLLKSQIIREGQKFCDEQMEANYMAGRPHGAWSGMKTLKDHNFITEEGKAQYTDRGWRSAPHKFTLTRNGRMFIEALLANRPEADAARRQAAGIGAGARSTFGQPSVRVGGGGNAYASPAGHTLNHIPPGAQIIGPIGGAYTSPGGTNGTSRNAEKDRAELEDWMETATVGESKLFDVGKDRRLKLHRLCDSLMEARPGLILTHSSVGQGRSRALTIQLVRLPTGAVGRKRSYSPGFFAEDIQASANQSPAQKRSRTFTPAHNAGMAAIKRQEQAEMAKEEENLKRALAESANMATASTPKRRHNHNSGVEIIDAGENDEEAILQRVIRESLRESERKPPPTKQTDCDVVDMLDSDDNDDRKIPASGGSARRKIDLSESNDGSGEDDNDVIEINDSQDDPIDLLDSQPQALDDFSSDSDDSLPQASGLHSTPLTGKRQSASVAKNSSNARVVDNHNGDEEVVLLETDIEGDKSVNASDETALNAHVAQMRDYVLSVIIDNRERNRNATPRAMRLELTRHFASGPLSAVWPNGWPLAQVEEEQLAFGDFGFSMIHNRSGERKRLDISIERKRANDLVQRSCDGDHLTQLRRMQQSGSLSFLLIEYDTKLTSAMVAYNSNDREGFDPLDSTITCEEDVYRMFGRAMLTSESIRFIQTKDEQSTLRSVGALGIIAASAPEVSAEKMIAKKPGGVQVLNDLLKQGGIPWRMAQRVARAVGGIDDLKELYDCCCDNDAKSNLLCHLVSLDGDSQLQGGLKSTAKGWSEAIHQIVMDPNNEKGRGRLNGEAALLLHKELVEDHGQYLHILYQHGCTPDEALDRVLSSSVSDTEDTVRSRFVSIHLTRDQAAKYFPSFGNADSFYKLAIAPGESPNDGHIAMRAVGGHHASKTLLVYEMEGTELADIVKTTWENFSGGSDFLSLTEKIAQRVDSRCRKSRSIQGKHQRVLLLCGLSSALDALARNSGYRLETRTVVDMVLSNLMVRRNVVVVQALRKSADDRVKVVQQLALACLHHGLLIEKCTV